MAAAAAAEAFMAAASKKAEDPVDEDGYPIMTHVVVSRMVREAGGGGSFNSIHPSTTRVFHFIPSRELRKGDGGLYKPGHTRD